MFRIFAIAVILSFFSGASMAGEPAGLVMKQSVHSVPVTVERLEKALEAKGIKVFAKLDHQANAARVGLELRPTTVVMFGNPKLGTPLMQSAQTAGIDLPMKVLVWERPVSGEVYIGYNDPAYIAERHGIEDRDDTLAKMSKALAGITDAAAGP